MSSRKRTRDNERADPTRDAEAAPTPAVDGQAQSVDGAEDLPAAAGSEPPAPVASEISELKPKRKSKQPPAAADVDVDAQSAGAASRRARSQPSEAEEATQPDEMLLDVDDSGEEDDEDDGAAVADSAREAPKTRDQLKRVLESLIFVSDQIITAQQLGRITKTKVAEVREMLAELCIDFEGRGIELIEVNGGYQFRSAAASGPYVRVLVAQKPVRLTRAQLETLALIAYRQPITRPEVDDVRGVDSGSALKVLLDRDLIKIIGRKEDAGRPLLYGTTPYFLEFFGMNSMQDLPTLREFTELSDEHRELFQRKTNEIGDLSAEAEVGFGSSSEAGDHDAEVTDEAADADLDSDQTDDADETLERTAVESDPETSDADPVAEDEDAALSDDSAARAEVEDSEPGSP